MRGSQLLVLDEDLVLELVRRREGGVLSPVALEHVLLDQLITQHLLSVKPDLVFKLGCMTLKLRTPNLVSLTGGAG